MGRQKIARAVAAGLVLTLGVSAAPAAAPTLLAIARIEPGEWQIKTLGSSDAPRLFCLADPARLIHFNRRGTGCDHRVVVDQADVTTVQYRCPGTGSGSVTFHVATPRAFDLDMQGIEAGLPYDDSYAAHRIGECPGASARSSLH